MNAEFAERGALQLAIGRMIFDPLRVAAKTVALMQHRHVAVGKPRAFVEMTAGERAQAVEMRLDVAEQRIGQMNAKQIRQRRIGAVEIHSGCIRRQQSRLLGGSRHIVVFARLVHLQLLFVPPRVLDDIDHVRIKQAAKITSEENPMAGSYRIIGAEMSPYSVKVRSYFRYKAIPHQWILRNAASQAEYEKYAKIPIIPLVVTPEGVGIQDSTPIIDAMETLYPEPSIHPDDAVTNFISALIEEFGDEWGNKWMFHYRWARDVDQISAAGRIARMRGPKASEQEHAGFAGKIRARMVDRVWFVGSNAVTAPQIEAGFLAMLELLDSHLAGRPYLFGGRPAFGDFGLWGQIYEMWTDPTAGAIIGGGAPHVLDWVHRMLWPKAEGKFEAWPTLAPTLMPILTKQVGSQFMPWTCANEKALAESQEEFSVTLGDNIWTQKPQKYHARSLGMLRAKYAAVADKAALDPVLEGAGCLAGLRG